MFVNISTLSFLQQLLSTFPSAEAKESNSIENNKKNWMEKCCFFDSEFMLVNLPISELNSRFQGTYKTQVWFISLHWNGIYYATFGYEPTIP